jgi:N-acetylneuraminate synthase
VWRFVKGEKVPVPKDVYIGNIPVGRTRPIFFVAEIGINHNGSLEIAKKLIDAAKKAGAQAVKFQKRTVPVVYSPEELAKPRQVDREILERAIKRGVLPEESVKRLIASDFKDSTNGDLKWALEFTKEEYKEIDRYCKERGILWFASPWDEESVDFLEEFNPPCYKVASACLTDRGLLEKIKEKKRPVILSTGMSTMEEIIEAINIIGLDDLIILHCISTYPAKEEELNLKTIRRFRRDFPMLVVGYSGHEVGIAPSIAAVAIGARLIERHITLDKKMFGSDQAASLEPAEFKQLIDVIREIEKVFGSSEKRVLDSEIPVRKKLRKE